MPTPRDDPHHTARHPECRSGPGAPSPYPFTIITLSSPLSLSSTIPPGYPLFLNDPSTSTSEVAYTQESMHNGDTTIVVTNADPGNHANGDGTTGEGLDFSYTAGTTVSLTLIPNPEGAIGVGTGILASSGPQNQTITFTSTAPTGAVVGGATYTPTATSTSGLTVALTIDSSTSANCSISGGVVSFTAAGSCTIDANQAGNSSYNPAPVVKQTFTVGKGSQTLSFTSTAPTGAVVGGATYTPAATSTSGSTVALTIDSTTSANCSISGGVVSFTAAGSCTIDANQAGNANYNAANQVQQTFTVGKGSQTITFTSTAPTNSDCGWGDLHAHGDGDLGADRDDHGRLDHERQLLDLGRCRELHGGWELRPRREPGRQRQLSRRRPGQADLHRVGCGPQVPRRSPSPPQRRPTR